MKWRKWEPEHAEKAHEMRRSLPFAWGAFEKALKRRGCPVCQVLREWEQRSLFSFLYEGMMSPPFCQKFLDGGGFCARHFFMVTHLGTNFWSVGAFEVANLCVPLVAKAKRRSADPQNFVLSQGLVCSSGGRLGVNPLRQVTVASSVWKSGTRNWD